MINLLLSFNLFLNNYPVFHENKVQNNRFSIFSIKLCFFYEMNYNEIKHKRIKNIFIFFEVNLFTNK